MKAASLRWLFLLFILPISTWGQFENDTTFMTVEGVEYYFGIDNFSYPVGGLFDYCLGVTNGSADTINWVFSNLNYSYDLWLMDGQTGDTVWVWSDGMGFWPSLLEIDIFPDSSWVKEGTSEFSNYLSGTPVHPGNYYLLGGFIPNISGWAPSLALPVVIEATGVMGDFTSEPCDFSLGQNCPNPFNAQTEISFSLPRSSYIKLKVYDLAGKLLKTLAEGQYEPGSYIVPFNGDNLASGIYFYRLTTEGFAASGKMFLIK